MSGLVHQLSLASLCALAGCGFEPKPGEIRLALDPKSVEALAEAPGKQKELEALLLEYFGTHAAPRYELLESWKASGLDPNRPEPGRPTLAQSAELYRTQCMHCHGAEGGGDGQTSATIHPKPRDFRKGIFKYTAVKDKSRPRREDLLEILEHGVYGTAMPSFLRLSPAEREGLADYTRLLSIRGEVESLLVAGFQDEEELDDAAAQQALEIVWERWQKAYQKVIAFDGVVPPDSPQMRARGRELYLDVQKGNCVSCHGTEGHGDGPLAFKTDAQGRKTPAYLDDWGFEIMPRDFSGGEFRGGSRPIDVYRRIYAGINGTPMPGIGEAKGPDDQPILSGDDLWALVHYVRSLAVRAE